jgi:hypothetical protein
MKRLSEERNDTAQSACNEIWRVYAYPIMKRYAINLEVQNNFIITFALYHIAV